MQPQQPPSDTRQFPPYAPGQDAGHGGHPGNGPHDGAASQPYGQTPPQPARRRLGTGAKVGIGVLVVLLVALVALVGLEFGMRKSLTDRIEREASASLGGSVSAELGGPVLLSAITGTLGSVHLSSQAGDPAANPSIDVTGTDMSSEGETTHLGSLAGTVKVSDQYMTRAAQQSQGTAGKAGENPLLGGLTTVQSVTSDPASGTLKASVGGLVDVTVVPRVEADKLVLQPQNASFLGFEIPSEVFGGAEQTMNQSLTDLPEGLRVTGVKVVDGGMELALDGKDVTLTQK